MMVNRNFRRYGKSEVSLHCDYSQVHYDPKWYYWLIFHEKIKNKIRNYSYSRGIPYNCKLFVLRIFSLNYNCLLRIVITYLKPYNPMQNCRYYWVEIINWNHLLISIYRNTRNDIAVFRFICMRLEYLILYYYSHNRFKKQLQENVKWNVQCTLFSNLFAIILDEWKSISQWIHRWNWDMK